MARTPKRITKRNLLKVPVLIEDTVSYSKYFEVSRLDSNFHAGKNGFLIRGTQLLKQNSEIFIEVLDRNGRSVFSNIVGGYSEGNARLASIEITQKTRKGPGKLVVVGTATNYEDGRPIPANQQQAPNIRWVFPIDIDPTRRNTSKLILANSPARILDGLSVERLDFNTVSRTDTVVTSSIYTASLEYDFEGHRSDGYAIKMIDNAGSPTPFFDDVNVDGYFTGSLYKREVSNLYDNDVLVPDSQSIVLDYVTASVYTPLFKTLNETLAITEKSIKFSNGDDFLNPILRSGSYIRNVTVDSLGGNLERRLEEEITSSVIFEYPTETFDVTSALSSVLNFRIPYTTTQTGEIAKVRISAKEPNPEITAWQLLTEFAPTERNILITGSSTGNQTIGRFLEDSTLQNNWQGGLLDITDYENSESLSSPRTLVTSSEEILEGFYADHTESAVPYFFGTQESFQLFQDVQYTLKYDAVYNPSYISSSTTYSTADTGSVKAYMTRIGSDAESKNSSSVIIATQNGVKNTYGLLVDEINTRDNDKSLYERQINFTVPRDGVVYPRFIVESGFWNFSNFVITPAVEYGFNPDEIVVYAEDTILKGTTYIFKIEFIGWAGDISDEFISDLIVIPPKGGGESIRIISNRQLFSFGSDGTPIPAEQTASIDVLLTNITDTPTFEFRDDDNVLVPSQFYTASNGNLNIELYHTAFGEQTASLNPDPTSSILLAVSASDVTDVYRFNRVKDATDGTPGAPGSDGVGARAIKITLSDYSVVYDQYGNTPSPTSITASAQAQNLEGGTYEYNFYRTGSFLSTITTGSLFVTASFETPDLDDYKQQNVEVQVSESVAGGVARDVEDFVGVTPGKDGWSIILTNTAHTLPADNDGNVPFPAGFLGSGTKIEVLNGANNLLPWTGSAPPNGYFSASVLQSSSVDQPDKTGSVVLGPDSEPTYVEFADLEGMEVASDLGSVTFRIAAVTGSVTTLFTKVQSFSKSTQGAPGSDGSGSRTVQLTLSDYSIVYDEFGVDPSPVSITASAQTQNLEGGDYEFNFYRTGSLLQKTQTSDEFVTASFITPPLDNYTAQIIEVHVTESATTSPNGVAFDNNEFFGITPGTDGWTIILSNESHTFSADYDGNVNDGYVGGGTDIEVLYGATNFTPVTTTPTTGEFSASVTSTNNIDADLIPTPTGVYLRYGDNPPNNMPAAENNASITYKITAVSGSETREFSKKQSFTKSNAGEDGVIYYIDTLNGTEFKTDKDGLTVPDALYFATRRSTGSAIQDLPSGSEYGLFYSGSGLAVSGSGPTPGPASAFYTASADDILNRAELQFYSASVLVDTVSVTDLTDGIDGESSFVYYITPLDGLQFKTNAQGTTTPERLIFQTQRSSGSIIENVPSGSFDGEQFGLFFSGSNLPLSGSGPDDPGGASSYYTASADDIFERAVIRYLTGSGAIGSRYIADSVSVEDLTDGQDGITPILEVSGAITFNSSSAGILPTGTSSITGSLIRAATTLSTISSSITPSDTTGLTVNAVGSSSLSVSSSWQLTADKDGTPIGYNFKFFSGSVGNYTQVGAQPFNINIDGSPGQDAPIINLILDGPVTYVSNSAGIAPVGTTSTITGSLTQGGTTYLASGSISASVENGFQTFTIGSGSSVISASWNDVGFDNTAYEFRFFSGSTGDYTQVKVQSYTIGKFGSDGQDGAPGTPGQTGSTGPGILYVGEFDALGPNFVFKHTEISRDVVSVDGVYYYFLSGSNTDPDLILDPPQSESLGNITASSASPTSSNSGSYWREFEFFKAVATDMLLAQDIYTHRTINVGVTESLGGDGEYATKYAQITLASDWPLGKNPYISIGQPIKDYAEKGIFIGSGSAEAPKLSLSGSTGHLLWDGSTLNVLGDISASSGYFSGSLYALDGEFAGLVTVGSDNRIKIGPGEDPEDAQLSTSNPGLATVIEYGNTTTPNEFTKGHSMGSISAGTTNVGEVVEFHLSLYDLPSAADMNDPWIEGINTMIFGVTQSGYTFEYQIPDYSDNVDNFIHFTASFSPLDDTIINTNFVGAFSLLDADLPPSDSWPENIQLYTSSLSASIILPTIAISNDGIYFDRGQGIESIFNLGETSIVGGSGGGGTSLTINNNSNDRVITATGASDAVDAETNLTYDGTTLKVKGTTPALHVTSSAASIVLDTAGSTFLLVDGYVSASGNLNVEGNNIGLAGQWQNNSGTALDTVQIGDYSSTGRGIIFATDGTADGAIAFAESVSSLSSRIVFKSDVNSINFQTNDGSLTNKMSISGSGNVGIGTTDPSSFKLQVSGDVGPNTDAAHDLGSASLRWANIYTADFHLSNESSSPNSVDGTHGNWTIQEGEEYLYIINNKSGKKYRFMLEEIE